LVITVAQPNLVWLKSFEAAARHLNFTEAAKELGLPQTALSLHVRTLEKTLGCKLFLRNARHLSLTEMGQAYVPTIRQALADINLATTSLFGPMGRRSLTVKVPISTATHFLVSRLPDFHARHPEIDIRLVSNIWADSTEPSDVDVEIRLGNGDWRDGTSVKLSEETLVPICPKGQREQITSPRDLLSGPLVHILGHEDHWDRYLTSHGLAMDRTAVSYFLDTTCATLGLVAAGGGFAVVLTRFAQDAIASGVSIALAGTPVSYRHGHYLIHRSSQEALRPEVQLFESWLRGCFSDATGLV
jgi:LysR family glycine cleavage system transcriptional activator